MSAQQKIIRQHWQPPRVTRERVVELVATMQAGIKPFECVSIIVDARGTTEQTPILMACQIEELYGIIDYLATENAIERDAVKIRDNTIRGLEGTVAALRKRLAQYEPEATC